MYMQYRQYCRANFIPGAVYDQSIPALIMNFTISVFQQISLPRSDKIEA